MKTRTKKRYFERSILAGSLVLLLVGCGDSDETVAPDSDAGEDAAVAVDSGAGAEDSGTNPEDAGADSSVDADLDAGDSDAGDSGAGDSDAGDAGVGDGGDSGADADAPACEALEPPDAALQCSPDGAVLSIVGEYEDDFGFPISIEPCVISGNVITDFSNDSGYIIAQNSCADLFNPAKWSRYDFTWFGGNGGEPSLFICQGIYDADSEADALTAEAADPTDPTAGGCGALGFPWSKLTPSDAVPADGGADASDAN